ncbi:MAG: thioredoxin-disulfide reductase [Candidatus Babeliaceae bacterium]|nr:thioredoxin-disulfide reductase [Candidatus Babeliaceae bacterium]
MNTTKNTTISAHHKVIVVGSGPAALTAAIYLGRAQLNPLVIEGDNPGGQLMSTTAVENWPGELSIMGPQLMMNMRKHAQHMGSSFMLEMVTAVDFSQRPFKILTSKNKQLTADTVIVSTGANPKRLNCAGEQEYWAKGVSTCAVCDGALYKDKKIVIIGGGDTAMEDASFMTHFTDKVTIIQISEKLSASAAMQKKVLENPKVTIIYSAAVKEFLGNGTHLTHIAYEDKRSAKRIEIPADAAFLAIGLTPNTSLFKNQLELTPYGHIVQKQNTQTSIPGIFAAGDVVDSRYRQAITSSGSGCMAALDAERYLSCL